MSKIIKLTGKRSGYKHYLVGYVTWSQSTNHAWVFDSKTHLDSTVALLRGFDWIHHYEMEVVDWAKSSKRP
jgi:hypothetical protein